MPPEGLGALLFCLLPPRQPAPDQARQSSLCTQAALFWPGGLRGHEGVAGAQGLEGHGLPQGLAEKGPLCPPPPGGSVAWRLWGAQDEEGAVWPYTDTGECPDGTAQPPWSLGGGLAAEPSPPGSPTLVLLGQAAHGSTVTQALRVGESPADPGAWDLPQTRLGSHSGRRVGDETRAGPPGTLLALLTSAQEAKSWLLRRGLPWAGSGRGSGNQLRPQSCSFAEK